MHLRAGTVDDVAYIEALQARPDLHAMIAADSHAQLIAFVHDPVRDMFVLEDAGTPAGFALLAPSEGQSDSTELVRLVVDPVGRGQGQAVVKRLADHVFDVRGAHRFVLDVAADNARAITAYNKAGFQVEGLLREAWARRTGDRSDLILMAMLASERPN